MNRRRTIFVMILITGFGLGHAQCDYGANTSVVCPDYSYAPTGTPSTCQEATSCDSLDSGYLVISLPDTVVLDVIENDLFYASNYSGCVAVLPLCYELSAVQNLVEIVVNNNLCCSVLNTQIPGLCDSIRSNFNGGSEVQNLNDLITVFEAFTMGDITPNFMVEALDNINSNVGNLQLFCGGITTIGYCSDSIDFSSANINVFNITPDVCPFADCIDTIDIKPIFLSTYPHQSTFKAIDLISAEGTMSTDHQLRSQNEVVLKPEFSVLQGVVFEITIEDCVTTSLEEERNNQIHR